MTVQQKIDALRSQMALQKFDAYIVPSSDPHQSEYVAEHWQARQWLSGFSGSAGTVVVTQQHVGLWTDSRYFLQAETELAGTGIQLHKLGVPHSPEHVEWLATELPEGSSVGFDGSCFSVMQVRSMQKAFRKRNISVAYESDLLGIIWRKRPALPTQSIFEHDVTFAGKTRAEKIANLRKTMTEKAVDFHFISTLDDIAWLFNIRGRDVACNPVAVAYAIIGQKEAHLFIDSQKVSNDLEKELKKDNIQIRDYDDIKYFLQALPEQQKVLLDNSTTSILLYDALNKDGNIVEGKTLTTTAKAVKNATEIAHLKKAMLRDALALVKLYRWLEDALTARAVLETEVAQQLAHFRAEGEHYYGESFDAIVGYDGNGAIVHYRAKTETCAAIQNRAGMLLLDSGGQYLDGTTDITRTTCLGEPTPQQKLHYTLVLKGHIAVATLKFPEGTRGNQIDLLARLPLWQYGLDYGHGTGHGVGFFLNVHEGPQSISAALSEKGNTPLVAGMITSNEPGFYSPNAYGIRIENLVLTIEAEQTAFGKFLAFETLSLFPISTKLVEWSLLTEVEKNWLITYNRRVVDSLAPYLTQAELDWVQAV